MQMAISNHYWYQVLVLLFPDLSLEVDGLPIWAKVGDLDISEEQLQEIEEHGVLLLLPCHVESS